MSNVIDLLRATGMEPRQAARGAKGAEYWSPCPGCGGDDRFHVWPDQNDGAGSWWCRGCGKGGDNIEFCRQFLGMTFKAACEHVGRDVPEYERRPFYSRQRPEQSAKEWQPTPAATPDGVNLELWRTKAAQLVETAHKRLMESEKLLSYLSGRGIDREAAERFLLGWLDGEGKHNCIFRPREAWGLPTVKKRDGRKKMLFIPRGLVLPYLVDGEVIRIRIRRPRADLSDKQPKYFNVSGSTMARTLVNPAARAFVVVEAELDAMAIDAVAGDIVGALAVGSSHAKPDTTAADALGPALRILVALDFDKAGAGAWPWWQEHFPQSRRWPVPAGKDPGEAYGAGVDVRAWIMAGLPPSLTIADRQAKERQVAGLMQGDKKPVCENLHERGCRASDQAGLDVKPTVQELAGLLRRFPVKIINRTGNTGIREGDRMQGFPAESTRISRLVFFDPDCWQYIADHPADVITGANFLEAHA